MKTAFFLASLVTVIFPLWADENYSAMANIPQFNGMRVKAPNNPAIYLVDEGCRRHVPNPATFENLFRNWNYYEGLDIYNIDECAPIQNGAHLAKCPSMPHVYLIDSGKKRHVTSPQVMDKYNFDWNKIQSVSCNVIDAIATGPAIY